MRFRRRLILLYTLFCVGLGLVWLRAGQLQILDGDAWADAARNQRRRSLRLDAPRGQILSADGIVLAEDASIFQLTVLLQPRCACGMPSRDTQGDTARLTGSSHSVLRCVACCEAPTHADPP